MTSSNTKATREERLSIRANGVQKTLLARAAKLRHMNVSQFVLQVSLLEAERVIREETLRAVPPEEFEWLCQIMDEATPTPQLRAALAQKPVWGE